MLSNLCSPPASSPSPSSGAKAAVMQREVEQGSSSRGGPELSPPPEPIPQDRVEQEKEKEGYVEREGRSDDEQKEEEMECGFCLFMKGGGCKDSFVAWEKCVEEAEKNKEDIVDKCFEVTGLLRKCMDAHANYYEPILKAEKAMEEKASEQSTDQEAPSNKVPKEEES